MSLPEILKLELEMNKPHLAYKLGEVVFLKSDTDRQFPMLITNYEPDEDFTADYWVTWLDANGKTQNESFPEECLILKTE